jgi:site-specific recombinase XerD
VKLKNLNAMHLHRVYREKLDDDLSPATVQEIHQVLHKALGQAVRWDLIPRNPAHSVEAPTPAPKEMRPLSVDEAKRLLEASGSMQHREPRSRAESAHPPTRISMRSRYMSW